MPDAVPVVRLAALSPAPHAGELEAAGQERQANSNANQDAGVARRMSDENPKRPDPKAQERRGDPNALSPGGREQPSDGDGEGANTALEDNIQKVIGHLIGRMEEMKGEERERRRSCLKKTGHISNIILTTIITVVTLFWGIYGLYHFSKAANNISLESLTATEWSNYYTWVWTICPAEQARNLTTPECDEAQTHVVPPPKKPDNFMAQTLSYRLAKRLVPLVNGSREFESLVSNTDETCGFGNGGRNITTCSQYTPWPSIQPDLSLIRNNRRSFNINVTFPLPSHKIRGTTVPPHVPLVLRLITLNLLQPWVIIWCYSIHIFIKYSSNGYATGFLRCNAMWHYSLFIATVFHTWVVICFSRIVDLATWISQDTFLDTCLATKGSLDSSTSAICSHVFEMSSQLDLSNQARVWGIWRGFYFGRIQASNLDYAHLMLLLFFVSLALYPFFLVERSLLKWRRIFVLGAVAVRQQPARHADEQQPLTDFSED